MAPPLILVVDDSAVILSFARKALESAGYRVVTTDNPLLVATEVRKDAPDLILMDFEMPGLNGGEVIRTLQRYNCCPEASLVFFSSVAEEALVELTASHEVRGYIRKGSPLDAAHLVREVRQFIVRKPPKRLGLALVVDDSRAMRRLLVGILREAGFEVSEAAHGRDALRELDPGRPWRLALVDLHMPEMNGHEFVTCVRKNPAFDPLRILMVTSESDSAVVQRVMEAGANEYLMKPFNRDAILDKLKILGVVGA